MTNAIDFPSTTPSLGLPLLFAGQAQRDFFINQALSIVDALLPRVVVASLTAPPTNPADGGCYRVVAPATGDWSGQQDNIAVRLGGSWHFLRPAAGMTFFDQSAGATLYFFSEWLSAAEPWEPSGGVVVDVEAREAINAIIAALRNSGTF